MPVENVLLNIMAKVLGVKEIREMNLALEGTSQHQRQIQMLRRQVIITMSNENRELAKKVAIQRIVTNEMSSLTGLIAQKQAVLEASTAAQRAETEALRQKYLLQIAVGTVETDEMIFRGFGFLFFYLIFSFYHSHHIHITFVRKFQQRLSYFLIRLGSIFMIWSFFTSMTLLSEVSIR